MRSPQHCAPRRVRTGKTALPLKERSSAGFGQCRSGERIRTPTPCAPTRSCAVAWRTLDASPLTEPASSLPLAGVRVLDLTRVIAGPVSTRTLALFGADVLRIDSPRLPEIDWQFLDTGQGKRSTTQPVTCSRHPS